MDGRREIEEQLQLLANSFLNRDVENTTPIFHPPKTELAAAIYRWVLFTTMGKTLVLLRCVA